MKYLKIYLLLALVWLLIWICPAHSQTSIISPNRSIAVLTGGAIGIPMSDGTSTREGIPNVDYGVPTAQPVNPLSVAIGGTSIDLSASGAFNVLITGSTNFSFSRIRSGTRVDVAVTSHGSNAAVFPSSVFWSGTTPSQSGNATDIYSFHVVDHTIYGSQTVAGASRFSGQGAQLWLNADSLSGTTGTVIQSWPDISGSGNNATAVSGASGDCTLVSGSVAGHNSVLFSSANSVFTTPSFNAFPAKRGALVVVYKVNGTDVNGSLFVTTLGGSGSPWGAYSTPGGGSQFNKFYDGSSVLSTGTIADTFYHFEYQIWNRTGDTSLDWYRSGILAKTFTIASNQASSNPLLIANDRSSPFDGCQIAELISFPTSLSGAQVAQVNSYISQKYCRYQIVCDGNSLTSGQGAIGGLTYPIDLERNNLSGFGTVTSVGVSGQHTTDMITRAPTYVDAIIDPLATQRIVIAWEGTNDLFHGGINEAQALQNVITYCQGRRAVGYNVIICTVTPRTEANPPAGFEVNRRQLNADIRAQWPTFADGLADIAADANLGPQFAPDATTYYVGPGDNVHMNNAGYAIVARIIGNAVKPLLK